MVAHRSTRLTDLELEVMQVVWRSHPRPVTVRDVVDRMRAERGSARGHAYTTIQTMLNILCKKGALRSEPGPGRALAYRSLLSRGAATRSMTRDFVERLFGGEAKPLFAQLLKHESLSREELEHLRGLIDSQLDDDDDGDDVGAGS